VLHYAVLKHTLRLLRSRLLHTNQRDLGETLVKGRRLEFGGHALHDVLFDLALALAVPFQANFKGNIKNTAWTS